MSVTKKEKQCYQLIDDINLSYHLEFLLYINWKKVFWIYVGSFKIMIKTCIHIKKKNYMKISWIILKFLYTEILTFLLDLQKSKRVPEKRLFLLYWLCQSLWLCGSQKLWEILKEMGIPDHLTCLLRNVYAGQEATVRTGHGTTD